MTTNKYKEQELKVAEAKLRKLRRDKKFAEEELLKIKQQKTSTSEA